ncbi:MAG TPA: hypothetical protein VGX23_30440 [Actinocrinis sp.]|nr:hypothetical protein [Actinocrinis sp.]
MGSDGFGETEGPVLSGLLRLLGPLAPAGVRRAARMERVTEEMARATALGDSRGRPDGAFDPNLGASGRPPTLYGHSGGPQSVEPVGVMLRRVHYWDPKLTWSGTELTITQDHLKGIRIPLPLAPRTGAGTGLGQGAAGAAGVAEVALFVSAWGSPPHRRFRIRKSRWKTNTATCGAARCTSSTHEATGFS